MQGDYHGWNCFLLPINLRDKLNLYVLCLLIMVMIEDALNFSRWLNCFVILWFSIFKYKSQGLLHNMGQDTEFINHNGCHNISITKYTSQNDFNTWTFNLFQICLKCVFPVKVTLLMSFQYGHWKTVPHSLDIDWWFSFAFALQGFLTSLDLSTKK